MGKFINLIVKSNTRILIFCIFLSLLAYGYVLNTPFKTIDDYVSIVNNPHIKSFIHLPDIFRSSFFHAGAYDYYRPMVSVSFMVEYHLFGLKAFFYNLTNLLLHAFNGFLLFLIINEIYKDRRVALGTGALFIIHPIHWEAVTNIPGRSNLLAGFFVLLSFLLFVKGDTKKDMKASFLSLIFFALAMLSKESAVVVPFLFVAYAIFIKRDLRNFYLLGILFLSGIVAAAYFFLRKSLGIVGPLGGFPAVAWDTTFLNMATFLKGLFIYFKLVILPHDLYYDRSIEVFNSFNQAMLWIVVGAWFIILALLFIFRWKMAHWFWFSLSWTAINLLTVSQIFPVLISANRISLAEHFFYLPILGVIFPFAVGLKKTIVYYERHRPSSVKAVKIVVSSYVIFLLITTFQQDVLARHQIIMFRQALEINPDNVRVRSSLGTAYALRGLYKLAESEFRKVVEADPTHINARISLGKTLCDQNKYWEGIQEYEIAKQLPGLTDLHKQLLKENLSSSFKILIDQYKEKIVHDPKNAGLYYSLGVVLAQSGNPKDAFEAFQKSVELNPNDKNAVFNLASIYEALSMPQEALMYYKKTLTLSSIDDEINKQARKQIAVLEGNVSK